MGLLHFEKENLKDTFFYLSKVTAAGKKQAEHDANVKAFLEAINRNYSTLNESKTITSGPQLQISGYDVGHGLIKPDPERLRPLKEFPASTGINYYIVFWVYLRITQNGLIVLLTKFDRLPTLKVFR